MTETATIQKIYAELKDLKREVIFIKKHMVESETLTQDDIDSLREAEHDLREGKTKRVA